MSKKNFFYLTKDFFYFGGILFKIIDLVGVAARSRPKKCSFIEKNRFEKVEILNFFFQIDFSQLNNEAAA